MKLKTLPLLLSRKLHSIPFVHNLLRDIYCLFRPGIRATVTKVFRKRGRICVLKIGANDGLSGDPIAAILLQDRRYEGMLVEPLPQYAAQLKSVYGGTGRFELVQAAISDLDGEVDIHFFDESKTPDPHFPAWYREIASLDKTHLQKHMPATLHGAISAKSVEALSVPTLLERCGLQSVDLLHIDTEGHDYRILRQFDLRKLRTAVVIAEHKHLNAQDKTAMKTFLEDAGFSVRQLEADFLAVSPGCST